MSFSEQISPLIGRVALGWFFLSEAWIRLLHWTANAQLMAMQGIPAVQPLLAIAIMVMVMGGLSLVLGYQARAGALLLFALVVLATLELSDFWTFQHGGARDAAFQTFATNIAIAGALLLLVGMGPGPFALDNHGGK